jgi:hypothetical protein
MNDTTQQPVPTVELERIVVATNLIHVPDSEALALTDAVVPIMRRLPDQEQYAETLAIKTPADAERAAKFREYIIADAKDSESAFARFMRDDSGVGLIDRLYQAHRAWTSFRNRIAQRQEAAAKLIKQKIGDYEQKLADEAAEKQRQLQAEADEKARREREALAKKAENAKKPETQQKYAEAAAAVVAPVVTVPVFKTATRFQERWFVKDVNKAEFVKACMANPQLLGYVTIDTAAMQRAKAANAMTEIPGVVFEKRRV